METQAIYVHATNVTLARTLNLLDPFIVTGERTQEQTAILAGFETELDMVTR